MTNRNAPNYRLVMVDFNNLTEQFWNILVDVCFDWLFTLLCSHVYGQIVSICINFNVLILQEHPNDVLKWAAPVDRDKIVISYQHDVKVRIKFSLSTFF